MESEREYTTQVESTNVRKRRQIWAQGKLLPALFSIFLILLVLSPIIENFRAKATDGFPLSHFPMFTSKREATASVTHLVGLDASGNRYVIPHRFAGTGGMNQARKQISKSARNKVDAPKLCQTVAEKVAARRGERYGKIVKVVIVSGEYNLNDYFAGAKNPVEEKVRVSCDVKRNTDSTINPVGENTDVPTSTERDEKEEANNEETDTKS